MDSDVGDAMLRLERAVDSLRGPANTPDTTAAIVAIDAAIKHAKQLLSFQVRGERGDPFFAADFGKVPLMPKRPMLPALETVRGADHRLDELVSALDAVLAEVVFVADCQESIDAINTSNTYLYAAGTLATIEPHVLVLANQLRAGG